MSDQNIITDYVAYFASLPRTSPFSTAQIEAMRDKNPKWILILDTQFGSLLDRIELDEINGLDQARVLWETAGKPAAWIMHGNSSTPMFILAGSVPAKNKVRSKE